VYSPQTANTVRWRRLQKGDETDSRYLILSGRVKMFLCGEDGREAIINTSGRVSISAKCP
jgi:CRP-like cAMP-binding protein